MKTLVTYTAWPGKLLDKQCTHVHLLPRSTECGHGLAMRILSVRLSVRPSVKRVICDRNERKISTDFYTIRKII